MSEATASGHRGSHETGDAPQQDRQPSAIEGQGGKFVADRQGFRGMMAIPLASLLVLVLFVALVWGALFEANRLGGLWAPLIAGLVAIGIVVTASRGWLEHDPRTSFARLFGWILGLGSALLVGTVWLLQASAGAPADLPAGSIAVLAREYELVAQSWSAPEGEVTINYESGGQIGHTLTIEGHEGEFLLKVSPSTPMDSGSIRLDEGVYTVYCDLKGHRELGMEATLEIIEESGSNG
jgi:hypothetical protein